MINFILPKKLLFQFTLIILLLVLVAPSVLAASLSLDYIGSLATEGNKYTSWWYLGSSPTLSGKGTTGETVTVTIDDAVGGTDTVDDSENWSVATSLSDGDHDILIESGEESYGFMLSLNNGTSAGTTGVGSTAAAGTIEVPDTGSNQVFALTVGTSLVLLGYYIYHIHTSSYRKKSFESDVLNSLK